MDTCIKSNGDEVMTKAVVGTVWPHIVLTAPVVGFVAGARWT